MKHTLLYTALLLSLASGSHLFAAEDHGHDDLNSGFTMSADEDEHGHEEDGHKEKGHDDHSDEGGHGGHDEDEGEGGAELSAAQLAAAGIVVETLKKQSIRLSIIAPGEVLFNAYESKKITPRINAQVIKRHKKLGDHVKNGQVLVSLSSVEMAQAQGDLVVADQAWKRVKKMGKKVVSDRRFVETQIARQQAYAKVLAFGMTKKQINTLLRDNDLSKAVGGFNLVATQNGTITHDAFIEGEIINPGRVLFEITNEKTMWVEARLTPKAAYEIKVSNIANINFGEKNYSAKVIQIHHKLDETTRTIAIRLEVENENDDLHPGLFVQANIQTSGHQSVLALPISAVLRNPDGDWAIFVEEEPGHFKPKEITLKGQSGNLLIIDGVEPGTRVVTKGAFFVQSEIAKSGFSVHNH